MEVDHLLTSWERFRRMHIAWQVAAWVLVTPLPVAVWAISQPRDERLYAIGLAVLVAAAWVTIAVTSSDNSKGPAKVETATPGSTSTIRSTTTTTAPPTTSGLPLPSTTTATAAAPPSSPASLVDLLIVAAEGSGAGYDRALFEHWIDADHDGCDTREEVLVRQSTRSVTPGPGCTVGAGSGWWVSIYDNYSTDDPGEFDVDHVVALAEAWQSGASTWTAEQRRAFANDLDNPQLIAVTAATNRSKSDRDPASWQPPNRDAWCTFATSWVTVKVAWHLTADAAEVKALRNMLVGC